MHEVYPSSSIAEALPVALTAHILQHVPLSQRLTQCSLVSQAWAAAAVLATQHVERRKLSIAATPALESWLQQHAGQLLSLQLSSSTYDAEHKLRLPLHKLAKLQRLQLDSFMLRLPGEEDANTDKKAGSSGDRSSCGDMTAAGPSQLGAPVALRSLQQLQLTRCQLFSTSSLLQLAQAPQLTCLETKDMGLAQPQFSGQWWVNEEATARQQLTAAIPVLLQQLPRLSVLVLPGLPFPPAAAQQTAAMQGLQYVSVERLQGVACDLQRLPSSITRLQLNDSSYTNHIDSIVPPQLQQFTALLHLDLCSCALSPALLGGLTQLQDLRLAHCALLPIELDREFNPEGTAALLDALQKLRQLQHLHLQTEALDTVDTAPQRFSALTASSHLTKLRMDREDYMTLPVGAAQYMFAADRQLPKLQSLTISPNGSYEDGGEEYACMVTADLMGICRSCPALRWLDIQGAVQPGADLSVLRHLPSSCETLEVGGAAFTDKAASVLAQLTQLTYLCWSRSPGLTDAGLEQLTAMKGLHCLYVHTCDLSEAVSEEDDIGTRQLQWHVLKGSVAEQLDALLDSSPVCAPARLKRHRAESRQLQEDNQELQEEVDSLRRQLACSQGRVRQLEQQ